MENQTKYSIVESATKKQVVLNETPDIANHEQLSIVIIYVTHVLQIKEIS